MAPEPDLSGFVFRLSLNAIGSPMNGLAIRPVRFPAVKRLAREKHGTD